MIDSSLVSGHVDSPITENPGDNEPDCKGHREDDDSRHRLPDALRQPVVPPSEEGDHRLPKPAGHPSYAACWRATPYALYGYTSVA